MKPASGYFLLFLLFLLTAEAGFAQSQVQILRSDRVQSVQSTDGLLRKLTGNVHLRTNEIEIISDSAWHYVDLGQIHGFGNLKIDTEKETIWSDKVVYYVQDEISTLSGRVIIETSSVTIYSEAAIYSFLTEIALFNSPIWMQDENGVLKAESGVYFSMNDSAVFRGNVQLADSTQYIEADSMFTNRDSKYYRLYGQVYMQDDENRSRLRGNFVESDSSGQRLIEGDAVLRRLNKELTDTTWMHAARIEMTKIDTFYIIDAVQNVEIWQIKNASRSDSARYNEQTELFQLRKNPVVWYERVQLNGEEIDIQFQEEVLQTLFATGSPFAAQEDSVTLRINQMKGDSLTVFFLNDEIDRIHTLSNAEILMHYTNDDNEPDGAINLRAQKIFILFEEGDVADLKAYSGIEGDTFEESEELANMQLEGFDWNPELRPRRPGDKMEPRLPELSTEPPFVRRNAVLGLRRIIVESE